MRLNAQNTLNINLYLIRSFQQKVQLPCSKYFTSKILNLYTNICSCQMFTWTQNVSILSVCSLAQLSLHLLWKTASCSWTLYKKLLCGLWVGYAKLLFPRLKLVFRADNILKLNFSFLFSPPASHRLQQSNDVIDQMMWLKQKNTLLLQ